MAEHATVLAQVLADEIQAIAKQTLALPAAHGDEVVAATHVVLMSDIPTLVARLKHRRAMIVAALKAAAER